MHLWGVVFGLTSGEPDGRGLVGDGVDRCVPDRLIARVVARVDGRVVVPRQRRRRRRPPSSTATTACPTRYLSAKAGLAQGTAGSIYQVIDFTNISNAPCTLYGYPGVSLASGTPVTQVGAAASRSTATAATLVTLGPGQTANALLRIVEAGNYSPATCTPTTTTYLQIYPPNQTTPIYLGYKSTGCASSSVNLLSVSVVTAGTGG